MSSAVKTKAFPQTQELEVLRKKIDEVDEQLVALLEKRAAFVFSVGDYKRKHQLPAHDPEREAQIKAKLRRLTSSTGPLSQQEMESLFATLIEGFRFLESAHMQKKLPFLKNKNLLIDFSKSQQVVLWGFGLMASSFYLALSASLPHWNFFVVDPYLNVDQFIDWKMKHQLSNIDLINSDQMHKRDIYVLAAPIAVNAQHLAEFNFPKGSLVFDLGSTKQAMTDVFFKRQDSTNNFVYIGGHPLAGRECTGFENGDALLFYNKTFCWVAPSAHLTDARIQPTFDILASYLGANPVWIEAQEHDVILAWTSHLPQLLSSSFAQCLNKKDFAQNAKLFPGVIRDLLRVSGSPYAMWQSIFETNRPQLQAALSELIQQLVQVQQDLESPQACEVFFQQSNDFYNRFKKGV